MKALAHFAAFVPFTALLLLGCAPVTNGSSDGSTVNTTSNTMRSFNFSSPVSSPGFSSSSAPLMLEWQSLQSLDADFDVSFCDSTGSNCTKELTVLCAGHSICDVQLQDGTKLSSTFLSRFNQGSASGSSSSSTSSTSSGGLSTAISSGFQGFHLELCGFSQSVVPTGSKLLIQAKNSDGTTGDRIFATSTSISSQGRCPR